MRTQQGEWTKGQHAKTIGLNGPMSNYASPPQLVENVPYANLEEMHAFAWRWREEHRGQWFTGGKLSGFCLLMKRAVYQAIGGLDEQFGLGFFDDDDLAERARRAGFELAVAHDLFVHHFGSRTFQGNGIDTERLLQEKSEKFAHKWGLPVVGQRVSVRPCVEGGNGPQMTQMNAFVWVNDFAAARKAVLHRKAGQPAEAEACWRRILTLKRPDQFCSVDQGIYGHLTLRNLAVLAEERGDSAEAFRLWKMVLDACPRDTQAMACGDASH